MPSLAWNRRWATKLAGFRPGGREGQHYGDRWGDPLGDTALASIRERFLAPFVRPEAVALEIGSGGGRWTQFLLDCRRLYCVELNAEMFGYLTDRFGGRENVRFIETDGTDMPGVPERSIDFVFSYGVLVHLERPELGLYLDAIAKVLQPHGAACLHVANSAKPGWRDKDGFAETDVDCVVGLARSSGLVAAEIDDETLPHSTVIRFGLA